MIASTPPTLWLVTQAFGPLRPCWMPMWPSTLLGSVRSSHIGLTVLPSSRPNAGSVSLASVISGKKSYWFW